MADHIKIPVDVELAQSQKSIGKLVGGLRQAEKQGGKASKTLRSMGKNLFSAGAGALGLSVGIAGVFAAMKTVHDLMLNLAKLRNDMFKSESDHMAKVANELSRQAMNQALMPVTGMKAFDIEVFARQQGAKYDIDPEKMKEMWLPLATRRKSAEWSEEDVKTKILPIAAMANRAFQMGGKAGDAAMMLGQHFGMKTPEQLKGGMAELGFIAEQSGFTAGDFAEILGVIGPSLKIAGLKTLQQQAGYISAFSQYDPKSPHRVKTALLQMSSIATRVANNPYMQTLLRDAGLSDKKTDIESVRRAIVHALNKARAAGGEQGVINKAAEIQHELGLPEQVMTGMIKAALGQFQGALDASKTASADKGGWAGVRKRVEAGLSGPAAGIRKASALATIGDLPNADALATAPIGSSRRAEFIVSQFSKIYKGSRGGAWEGEVSNAIDTRLGPQIGDEGLTREQAEEFLQLEALHNKLLPILKQITRNNRLSVSDGSGHKIAAAVAASGHIRKLKVIKSRILNWDLLGDREDFLEAYRAALRKAIRFLDRVEAVRRDAGDDTFADSLSEGLGLELGSHETQRGNLPVVSNAKGGAPAAKPAPTTQPTTQPAGDPVSMGGSTVNIGNYYPITPGNLANIPDTRGIA